MKLGILSDTHGIIHPDVFNYFDGVDLILHAGDIGSEDILVELEAIAPVKAVYGNTDYSPITERCARKEVFTVKDKCIYLTHILIEGSRMIPSVMNDIANLNPEIVVFGHTHTQHAEIIDGTLYFNPGGAGQRRPGKRLGLGTITIDNGSIDHEIFYLD